MAMASIDLDAMQSLVTTMNTAASDLRGIKGDLAGILGGVSLDTSLPRPLETTASWVEGQVPGLRRRLAEAQAIAAAIPNFKAGTPVEIDESKLSTLTPAEAQRRGREAADRINEGGEDGPDPELAQWLSEYANDPYFASALAKETTPDQIATYLRDSGYTMGSTRSGMMSDSEEEFQEMLADHQLIVAGLSTALSTATRNESPDLALDSGYAQEWADAITSEENINGEAAILGNLLKDGAWGTGFLDTVATSVYDYETNDMADSGQRWADRVPDSSWHAYDANGDYIDVRDPLAGIMSALGHNPDAAQQFFSEGGNETVEIHDREVEVNSRMQYLLQDRTWSGSKYSDEGDGLGQALRAASVTYRNREDTGETSATIASQTIALIGSKTNDGSDGGFLGIGQDDGWKMYEGMRDEIADIVADYVPDLYRHYSTNSTDDDLSEWITTENSLDIPGGPYGMNFMTEDMDKILNTLGEDSENMDKISVSTLAFNRVRMTYQLTEEFADDPEMRWRILSGEDVPAFTNAAGAGPSVLGAILQEAYEGKKNEEELEQAKADALKAWLDVAGSIPALKIPGEGLRATYANWGLDTLKGAALDRLGESPETADSLYAGADTSNKEALQRDTLNVLLQNGFFDDATIAEGNSQLGEGSVAGPPRAALTFDEDGNVKGFNYGSEAFQNWTEGLPGEGRPDWYGRAPGMKVPDELIQKYDQQFPNIG